MVSVVVRCCRANRALHKTDFSIYLEIEPTCLYWLIEEINEHQVPN